MNEADWDNPEKPILGEQLIAEVSAILGITDPRRIEYLATRMQRYSDRYFFAKKRARYTKTPGQVRQEVSAFDALLAKVEDRIDEIAFIDEVAAGYRAARRASHVKGSPSVEGFKSEVCDLRKICSEIIDAPALPPGERGRPLLRHAVGSFMALFETTAEERPRHTAYQDGDKGDFLACPGGIALRKVFEVIAPDIDEGTIARLVRKIDAEFADRPMREGDFDLISRIEDAREFTVSIIQHQ